MRIFLIKTVNLLLVLGLLLSYNYVVLARNSAIKTAEQKLAALEAERLNPTGIASDVPDGVYTGTGQGFGGAITLSVTVDSSRITKIDVLSAEFEDAAYFETATALLDEILATQSLEVDTISGATFSSRGLIEAVRNAIKGEV